MHAGPSIGPKQRDRARARPQPARAQPHALHSRGLQHRTQEQISTALWAPVCDLWREPCGATTPSGPPRHGRVGRHCRGRGTRTAHPRGAEWETPAKKQSGRWQWRETRASCRNTGGTAPRGWSLGTDGSTKEVPRSHLPASLPRAAPPFSLPFSAHPSLAQPLTLTFPRRPIYSLHHHIVLRK
ncbi:hypothetical protein E2C01_052848 [Portunus trituberculatus]|uniref:Uncharacterized protein n=1 Tax=Portunus trituberculatus TaxID=210409 RepID=A0A5B7GNJ5_PORTR|nr:hypothetical protein [Portunus trituberculatus]